MLQTEQVLPFVCVWLHLERGRKTNPTRNLCSVAQQREVRGPAQSQYSMATLQPRLHEEQADHLA